MKEKKNENIIEGLKKMLDEAGIDYTIEEVTIPNKRKKEKDLDNEIKEAVKSTKQSVVDNSKSYIKRDIDTADTTEEKIAKIQRYIKAVLEPAIDILKEMREDLGLKNVLIYFDGEVDDKTYCNAWMPSEVKTTGDIIEYFSDITLKILKAKNKFNINEDADEDE